MATRDTAHLLVGTPFSIALLGVKLTAQESRRFLQLARVLCGVMQSCCGMVLSIWALAFPGMWY